ncbi:MAG TPA: sugar transferase [Luteitalea sp.]|nr:sugar transferase [Luteitalea sp.]
MTAPVLTRAGRWDSSVTPDAGPGVTLGAGDHPGSRARYVLGTHLFRATLARERRRADRLASPFAVVIVDRSHLPTDAKAWQAILGLDLALRCDVGVAGWLEENTVLGVLLPDTAPDLAAKATRRLERYLEARLHRDELAGTSVRLYTHASDADARGSHPPVDLLIESFTMPATAGGSLLAKRTLDVCASLALLLVFAPLMLLAYLAVRLSSPGPVLFRQTRIGRRGEPFTMLKFRSMRVDSGHAIHNDYVTWFITASSKQPRGGDAVYKLTHDPRVTAVGHWLRRTSLDELPQFWNVLRGDMSLVGPRPPLPFEVDKYQPWHRRRVLDAQPGITGTWQVNGRSRTTFDDMVRMDLQYVRTRSLWTDIKILAATPLAMVKGAC